MPPSDASVVTAALVFMGAMMHVMYTDLTRQRIYNSVILVLLGLYFPLALTAGFSLDFVALSLGTGLVVFLGGFACFSAGWLGGGDVKLAAVSAVWLGPGTVIPFLLWTAILGSIVTVSIMVLRRKRAQEAGLPFDRAASLPYGPGMALAAIILFPQSSWGMM